MNKEGEVHAFEPSPHSFQLLEKTTKDLFNVFLNEIAVSEHRGSIDFYVLPKSPTMNSPVKPSHGQYRKIAVKSITLDEYCRQKTKIPDFLKIDVEGHEDYVIKGAKDVLASSNVIISMEMFKNDNKHLSAAKRLLDYGYKPYLIDEGGEINLISPGNIAKINDSISKHILFDNLIFRK